MNNRQDKLRIFYLIETTGQGGAETVLIQLASKTVRHFASMVGVPRGEGWLIEQLRAQRIPFLTLRTGGSCDLRLLGSIMDSAMQMKADIIHAHMFTMGFYAALAGSILKLPVIVTLHGMVDISDTEELDRKARLKITVLNRFVEKVVVVSNIMRSYCENLGFHKDKLETIHNGVDLNHFYPLTDKRYRHVLGFSEKDILVGTIGNIRKVKGHDHYIQAAKLTLRHIPEAKFLLIGQGNGPIERDLHSLVDQLGLKENFFFLGYRKDIPQILSALDAFVLPSVSEGFSIATIEAMAMRVPVVATKSGGPAEIIQDGENGFLVTPGNPHELSEAILKVLQNGSSIQKCLDAAYSTVRNKFSLENQINAYEGLYLDLIRQYARS